jgi:3-oxoacyl-[acyl-carrier-protein] synthase-3
VRARARVADVSSYLPSTCVDNEALLADIEAKFWMPDAGHLQKLCGIRSRHFAAPDEQVSDLAVAAARCIVSTVDRDEIDLLVFASASSDLIEPATANIVQHKLGLRCPAMDVKNACNSFASGIHVASAMIENDAYRRALIVNGEKLSDSIRWRYDSREQLTDNLASFTFGDAGAAMLLERTEEEDQGIVFQRFMTRGEHWKLCTIPGGGSLLPHDLHAYYFSGQTAALRGVVENKAAALWQECRAEIGWEAADIDWVFTHQVSDSTFHIVMCVLGVPPERGVNLFATHGNMAAASIPVCMATVKHRFRRGDKILLVGLAAGISISFQAIVW